MRMRATVLAGWLAALAALPAAAHAHTARSQRTVAVQVEADSVLVLATWTAPTGVLGPLLVLRAALSQEPPKKALEAMMAKRALAPLVVELDGRPVAFDSIETKLTIDTGSQRRHTVTVLAIVALRGARQVRVEASSNEPTRLLWTAARRDAKLLKSNRPARTWTRDAILLSLPAR